MAWNYYNPAEKMTLQLWPIPIACPEGHCDFKRYILPNTSPEEIEWQEDQHDDRLCLEDWLSEEEE